MLKSVVSLNSLISLYLLQVKGIKGTIFLFLNVKRILCHFLQVTAVSHMNLFSTWHSCAAVLSVFFRTVTNLFFFCSPDVIVKVYWVTSDYVLYLSFQYHCAYTAHLIMRHQMHALVSETYE